MQFHEEFPQKDFLTLFHELTQQQFDALTSTSERRVKGPINTIDKLLQELVATNFDLNLLDKAL